MNKDEMLKDKEQMARIIAFELCPQKYHKEWYGEEAMCYADNNFGDCKEIKAVVDKLYNAGYRRVGEDEIVIKESEYIDMELFESVIRARNDYYLKYEKAKQETAREILQTIENYGFRSLYDKKYGKHYKLTDYMIANIKHKYGIELE